MVQSLLWHNNREMMVPTKNKVSLIIKYIRLDKAMSVHLMVQQKAIVTTEPPSRVEMKQIYKLSYVEALAPVL